MNLVSEINKNSYKCSLRQETSQKAYIETTSKSPFKQHFSLKKNKTKKTSFI